MMNQEGRRPKTGWIVTLVSLSYLLAFMQRTGPGVISDKLQAEFHVSATVLGTLTSIQYLIYMLLQIPVGLAGDKIGPERMLVAGVSLDGLGTLVFAHSHSYPILLTGRAIVGLGDALIWVNLVLILSRWFSQRLFGTLLGVVSTAGNVGALLTTIPFAAWTAVAGWRMPFTLLGTLLLIVALFDYLSMRKGPPPREDAPQKMPQVETMRKTLGHVVRDGNAWATFTCHFSSVGTYIGFVSLWAVPYLMNTYQVSRAGATVFTLVAFVGGLLGGPIAGTVSDKLRNRRVPYIVSQSLTTLAWLTIPLSGGKPSAWLLFVCMFLIGFGSGASLLTFAFIRDQMPAEKTGVTSGFANTGGFLSAVLLPVLFGFVIDHVHATSSSLGSLQASSHTYGLAFWVPTVFSVCGVVGAICLREHRKVGSEALAEVS